MTDSVLLNISNSIATLTLNEPDQLNAMSAEMGTLFKKHLANIKKNKAIRCVIITGAGRAFSSGGNLDMLLEKIKRTKSRNANDLMNFYKMFLGVRDLPQPVIAAINGPAVGAGFCLSLACDLRYAADTAKLGANFARIGLAPGMGGTYLITRLVGPTRAAEILMTGEIFTAQRAHQLGLLNDVFPVAEFQDRVTAIAQSLCQNGPVALQYIKNGIQQAQHKSMSQMFDYDSKAQAACFATQDIIEGIEAVKAKRPPQFTGK